MCSQTCVPEYQHVCVCVSTVKPSKPQCWMEGKLLEGGDVKMRCKSSDGSDPIRYKWERVMDKGKYVGKLPPLALIGRFERQHGGGGGGAEAYVLVWPPQI